MHSGSELWPFSNVGSIPALNCMDSVILEKQNNLLIWDHVWVDETFDEDRNGVEIP